MTTSTNRDNTLFVDCSILNECNINLIRIYIYGLLNKKKISSWISTKPNNPGDEYGCPLIRNNQQNKCYCLLVSNFCIVKTFHIDLNLDSLAIYIYTSPTNRSQMTKSSYHSQTDREHRNSLQF